MVKKKPQESDHKNDADIQDEPTDAGIHDGGDQQENVPEVEPAPPQDESQEQEQPTEKQVILDRVNFPIVGIGASAGGLEAFEEFFANMPSDSGMAFVLVQHLSVPHKSILHDLVRRYTRMEVFEVVDRMEVKPNCVYVIPPGKDMALLHGELHLMEPAAARGLRLPIDYFFRSLAQDQREQAICVVLSGTGSDGALGLKVVKGEGGDGHGAGARVGQV